MNILVLSNLYPPDFLGGYELGCRQVVEALRDDGHHVTVLTGNPRLSAPREPGVLRRLRLADVYDTHSLIISTATVHAGRNTEANGIQAYNVHALIDVLHEVEPDVVYIWNTVGLGGLGLMTTVQHLGYPWVMHVMDDVPRALCSLPHQVRPQVALAFARVLRGRYLCCSRTVLNEILNAGFPIESQAEVIPNWVTTAGTPGRTEWMTDGHLRIVNAGSVTVNKGVDLLIRAAGLLRERGFHDFSVDIFGPGNDPFFPSLIRELDLGDIVHLKGVRTQAELAELYPTYDVFAFPTWEREPFGFAPLEALAHGCLPVISRVCGLSEWLINEMDCVKSDRSSEGFADALAQIMLQKERLETLARRGTQTVLRAFHLDAILPAIRNALETAASQPRDPAGSAEEAYRLALLTERMAHALIQETLAV